MTEPQSLYYGLGADIYADAPLGDDIGRSAQLILQHTALYHDCFVLDIGCGNGQLASLLGGRRRIIGLDLSLDMLRRPLTQNTNRVNGDALRMPFRSGSFAATSMTAGSVAMFEDAERRLLLYETHRVLAPAGTAVLSLWHFPLGPPAATVRLKWGVEQSTGTTTYEEVFSPDGLRAVKVVRGAAAVLSQTRLIAPDVLLGELTAAGLPPLNMGCIRRYEHPYGQLELLLIMARKSEGREHVA